MPYKNPEDRIKQSAIYYQLNKEKVKKYAKDNRHKYKDIREINVLRKRVEHPEQYVLGRIRRSAKFKEKEFNLTIEDIVIPNKCPFLGMPLTFNFGAPREDSISVDRRDNNKGYIKGNVQIMSHKANAIKNQLTLELTKKFVIYMETGEVPNE